MRILLESLPLMGFDEQFWDLFNLSLCLQESGFPSNCLLHHYLQDLGVGNAEKPWRLSADVLCHLNCNRK